MNAIQNTYIAHIMYKIKMLYIIIIYFFENKTVLKYLKTTYTINLLIHYANIDNCVELNRAFLKII